MADDDIHDDINPAAQEKLIAVSKHMVRYILSVAQAPGALISRKRLQDSFREAKRVQNASRLTFAMLIDEVNKILLDIYGYKLVGVPGKAESDPSSFNRQDEIGSAKASHFVLLNVMPSIPELLDLNLRRSEDRYNEVVNDNEYRAELLGRSVASSAPLDADQVIVMDGILSVVLCIVLLSRNNIIHQELVQQLASFGIAIDGTKIPIVDKTIDELLKQFEKSDYLIKNIEHNDVEGELITYRIGRRTRTEFSLDSLVVMISHFMDKTTEELPHLKNQLKKVIGDAYS